MEHLEVFIECLEVFIAFTGGDRVFKDIYSVFRGTGRVLIVVYKRLQVFIECLEVFISVYRCL